MKQPLRVLSVFRDATDPVTGDHLSAGEHVSWLVQGVIRRWAFLAALEVLTIVIWLTRNPDALTWWNLGASNYAIILETVVGIAMFSQTKRDAVVIRTILRMEREHGELLQRLVDVQRTITEQKDTEDTPIT